MGSDRHYAEEAPSREVSVDAFWIDRYQVTNRQFAEFVASTGHLTLAERPADARLYPGADPAMLAPASVVFTSPQRRVNLNDHLQWWSYVPGATWRHPYGPQSSWEGLEDHPVVHVAYSDAVAYAAWAGGRLPTEEQWEYAAAGASTAEFAWGDELTPQGRHMANIWQGEFPLVNLCLDGYERTAPVGSFPANGFGLHDMIGNVWEWTATGYDTAPVAVACCGASTSSPRIPRKVMKGGSFLCAPNYCRRYRPSARMPQDIDTSTCHLGFRLVRAALGEPGVQ